MPAQLIKCLLSLHDALDQYLALHKTGCGSAYLYLIVWEVEAEGQDFEASLGYKRPCLKYKNKQNPRASQRKGCYFKS